jgi:methylmalonyl-CoA/ethylmalonyl-CoA epimerase
VGDIHSAYARLVEMNVQTEGKPNMVAKMPDHDLWLAAFRDSEGNMMALMAEVPH